MPELPEVETLRRELGRVLRNKKIQRAEIFWPKTVAPLSVIDFQKQIMGMVIDRVERRAKILIINFNGPLSLAFHLKMTGQLIFVPRPNTKSCSYEQDLVLGKKGKVIIGGHPDPGYENILPNKHTRLVFEFTDGSKLYFNDQRKFGWVRLLNDSQLSGLTENIGVEPLSDKFSLKYFSELFSRFPNRTIKQILMDQTLIAGIGNIYADESAFLAKIRPDRKAGDLNSGQISKLHAAIIEVLKKSIRLKGTSSRNYRRSDGSRGGFVPHLFVYGRAGQPCKICGTTIKKIRHAGRGTSYCPRCQK